MTLSKKELQKNRIDLEYKSEAQKANIFLTLGTLISAGIIAERFSQGELLAGSVIGFLIIIVSMLPYRIPKKKMKDLLKRIENL